MAGDNRAQLIEDLVRDEGFVAVLYDDYNDAPLGKGSVIRGNPTIGIGWACALTAITLERAKIICGWQVEDKAAELYRAWPWLSDMPEQVQRAVLNMAFNIGVHGEEQFKTFASLLQQRNFGAAADDLTTTPWHRQVGLRASRICALIRTARG